MKNRIVRSAVATAVLLALGACANLEPTHPNDWRVEPVMAVKHSMASSHAYYLLGRYHDGMQAWAHATAAYRKAAAANPADVEAHNALGVALARRARFDEAEAVLRHALAMDPARAHVRSNLGYVLLLAGRSQEAVAELTAAVQLDRADATALNNLREAEAQRPPEAAVAVAPSAAAGAPTPTPPSLHAIDWPTVPAFLLGAPSTLAQPEVATAEVIDRIRSTHSASAETARSDLELSNGNGIQGAAGRLKQWLSSQGVHARRLTNQRPYVQQQTVIQYRRGQEGAARRVAGSLPIEVPVAASPSAGLRTDVRVVLGRDWAHAATCIERGTCRMRAKLLAAASAPR